MRDLLIEKAAAETIALLRLVLPMMLVGMLLASFFYSLPQFRKVSDKITALASLANLKSGVAVAAFFAHKVTALSILADMYKKSLIDNREVMIASIIGMLPMGIRAVILLLAPITISALGLKLGMIYLSLELLSRFLVALIGVYLGRRYLVGGSIDYTTEVSLKSSLFDALKQFCRVLLVLVPTVFVVILLLNFGLSSILSSLNLDASQLVVIITGTSSTIAGIGVAGSLLAKGEIDGRVTLISLMIASALHRIIESLRHSMPINVSLFGSFGLRLTLVLFLMNEFALFFSITFLFLLITLNIL